MSCMLKTAVCAATLLTALLVMPIDLQALPAGAKSLPLLSGVILARRECIAWERDGNGIMRCVRWEECGPNVC